MKKRFLAAILFFATTATTLAAEAPTKDPTAYLEKARMSAKMLGKELKNSLKVALAEGGPESAIGICNMAAPEMSYSVGKAAGLEVSRTSLRWRNPGNEPDAWERKVLERFERKKAEGADPGMLEFYEFVPAEGRPAFRYMKAIPTAEVCLACHGSSLEPELVRTLDHLYPEDHARDFKVGDLRGAFTITVPLEK